MQHKRKYKSTDIIRLEEYGGKLFELIFSFFHFIYDKTKNEVTKAKNAYNNNKSFENLNILYKCLNKAYEDNESFMNTLIYVATEATIKSPREFCNFITNHFRAANAKDKFIGYSMHSNNAFMVDFDAHDKKVQYIQNHAFKGKDNNNNNSKNKKGQNGNNNNNNNSNTKKECWYGDKCQRKECPYTHPTKKRKNEETDKGEDDIDNEPPKKKMKI